MKISISATTDIGHGRENNEDAYVFCPNLSEPNWQLSQTRGYVDLDSAGALLVIADGMGGANAGEVASAIAIDTIKQTFTPQAVQEAIASEQQVRALLSKSIVKADEAINKRMWDNPETSGMGTTIVMCWLTPACAYVAWCGDSRCYVYNKKYGLRSLTKDHSYVQELIDRGELTEEEALTHPDNNVITRGLGDFDTKVQPDIEVCPVHTGDTFMLCSDGLSGYCTSEQIKDVVAGNADNTGKCAELLLQAALDAQSEDNICITMATILDDDCNSSKFQQFFKNIFG